MYWGGKKDRMVHDKNIGQIILLHACEEVSVYLRHRQAIVKLHPEPKILHSIHGVLLA
jgi:hypothetical protein